MGPIWILWSLVDIFAICSVCNADRKSLLTELYFLIESQHNPGAIGAGIATPSSPPNGPTDAPPSPDLRRSRRRLSLASNRGGRARHSRGKDEEPVDEEDEEEDDPVMLVGHGGSVKLDGSSPNKEQEVERVTGRSRIKDEDQSDVGAGMRKSSLSGSERSGWTKSTDEKLSNFINQYLNLDTP